ELFLAENHFRFFTLCRGPTEPPLLQPLGADPESAAVPEKQLQAVALRIGEQKHVPAQRIAHQPVAHQPVETFKALAHVRRAGCKINSCCGSDAEHDQRCSRTATSCRSVAVSKPRFTSIRQPPGCTTASSPSCSGRLATSAATHRGASMPAFCFRYRVT